MPQEHSRYEESLRNFATHWTDAQIREAIADEMRLLNDQTLSEVARDNSSLILGIYEEVLSERQSGNSAA